MSRGAPRHRVAILTWLSIYPVVTCVLALFDVARLDEVALPLRTLLLTAIAVPIAVFVVTPALVGLGRWMITLRGAARPARGRRRASTDVRR